MILSTDGITDVRPPHDVDPQELQTMIRHAAGASTAEEIASNLGLLIDAKLPFAARNDDIALLVLHVGSSRMVVR